MKRRDATRGSGEEGREEEPQVTFAGAEFAERVGA